MSRLISVSSPVCIFLSLAILFSTSLSPITTLNLAPSLSAYFICALTLLWLRSNRAEKPSSLISLAISSALSVAFSPSATINKSGFSACGNSQPCASIRSISLSSPIAKPSDAVCWPPSSSTSPSYLPPPQTVPCAPIEFETNSNTVFV